MILMMVSAGRRPSVRMAGLLKSDPTKTIVGRPSICKRSKEFCPALQEEYLDRSFAKVEIINDYIRRHICLSQDQIIPTNVNQEG